MHEATNQITGNASWTTRPGGWVRVVSSNDKIVALAPAELVAMVQAIAANRDRAAFAELFRHFGPRLKTFFMRGKVGPGPAEDLVQETMLSVWRKAGYFDPGRAAVTTWVFTIARNLRIDQMRRERNPADLPPDPEAPPPSQESVLLNEERDLRVRAALAGLTPEQQTIIRLSYYGEQTQSEIAEALGIPLGTVKSRTRLAMNRLRALLEDET